MTVTSGFFNSLNGDRRYSAEQFSALINTLVTDGIFANVGTAFSVNSAGGNNITIGIGRAWFNSVWVYNDALLPMTITNGEVLLNRIDAVVIEINHSEGVRAGRIQYLNGTPASNPVRPNMIETDEIHQYPLAYINRTAGAPGITQADITSMIGTSECPYITGILQTQNIDNIVAQWQSQFDTWFEGLDVTLEGDVAANLANQVLELQSNFEILAKEKTVYQSLDDAEGDGIQDSIGRNIQGRTVFTANSSANTEVVVVEKGNDDSFKVGDILTTVRTNLGNKWLLCNGATVERVKYPELSGLYESVPNLPWKFHTLQSGYSASESHMDDMIHVNGYFVMCGEYGGPISGDLTRKLVVYYVKDTHPNPVSGYKSTVIWSSTRAGDNFMPTGITYGNGYYVVAGSCTDVSGSHARIAYTNDLESGSWTIKDLWSHSYDSATDAKNNAFRVRYLNGQFIVLGRYRDTSREEGSHPCNGRIGWATYPSSSWTFKDIVEATGQYVFLADVIYHDGKYIVSGGVYSSSPARASIWWSTSLNGTWTEKTVRTGISSMEYLDRIKYINGRYVAVLRNNTMGTIVYCEELTGTWTYLYLYQNSGSDSEVCDIIFVDGRYIICGAYDNNVDKVRCRIGWCSGDNIHGTWKFFDDVLDETTYDSFLRQILWDGEYYRAIGDRTGTYGSNCFLWTDIKSFRLPEISLDNGTYTYIKTQE